jgi:hypothetical protein
MIVFESKYLIELQNVGFSAQQSLALIKQNPIIAELVAAGFTHQKASVLSREEYSMHELLSVGVKDMQQVFVLIKKFTHTHTHTLSPACISGDIE